MEIITTGNFDDLYWASQERQERYVVIGLVRKGKEIFEYKINFPPDASPGKRVSVSSVKIEQKKSFAANGALRYFVLGVLGYYKEKLDADTILMTQNDWNEIKQMKDITWKAYELSAYGRPFEQVVKDCLRV